MATCGVFRNRLACRGPGAPHENEIPHRCSPSPSRSPLKVELGSYWNGCGKMTVPLHMCSAEPLPSQDCGCSRTVHCAFGTREKVPSILQSSLNSCLCGWLSQFFSLSGSNKDDRVQEIVDQGRTQLYSLDPFSLEFESAELQKYHSQSLENANGSWLDCSEQHPKQVFGSKLVIESSANGYATAMPSMTVVQPLLETTLFTSTFLPSSGISNSPILSNPVTPSKEEASADRAHRVSPDELGSPDALALWLKDRLPQGSVQLSQWGTAPGTKGVSNLWVELVEGEILLEDANPPKRTVHVASVKIKNRAGYMLVEAHQEMADGTIRMRNRPLSEKMRPGENVEEACFRGISEELGIKLGAKNKVTILADSYRRLEEERESLSYPGLLTSYIIHSVDAVVDNLPETGFYTTENEVVGGACGHVGLKSEKGMKTSVMAVGVKKHFWRWIRHEHGS